ncbi:hypothetical protein SLA2020_223830 [Shorea laevis]
MMKFFLGRFSILPASQALWKLLPTETYRIVLSGAASTLSTVSRPLWISCWIVSAATKMSSFGHVSLQTQFLLSNMLADQKFTVNVF